MKKLYCVRVTAAVLGYAWLTGAAPIEMAAFADEAMRATAVKQLHDLSARKKAEAEAWARRNNLPMRWDAQGVMHELMAVNEQGRPIYNTTMNANAAISTAADKVRDSAPYVANGSNTIVGVWDGGGARTTHQEFQGRVTIKDGAAVIYHATHVSGTIGAAGVTASAKGMASSVRIDSYEWNNDTSEMSSRGASAPGQTTKMYVSNHSYGHSLGWIDGGANYYWDNSISVMADSMFGQYSSYARTWDTMERSMPYYLIIKAAGNDRIDNPSNGSTVYYWSGSAWQALTYNDSIHPKGDGVYKSGYDCLDDAACAKNILTVGAVNDAVSGGTRSLAAATMTTFSSWGPADDGRIKPDVVGNGQQLYSATDSSDTSYGSASGTSMATPNICGSAALLVDYYYRMHSGGAMRASTLKGLIIHTADDVGTAGPDYKFGWGLMNTKAAADIIKNEAESNTCAIIEDYLGSENSIDQYIFMTEGTQSFKATACWADYQGNAQSGNDVRSPALVNDLDLRVISPNGTVQYPFVMSYANPTAAAVKSDNSIDNVEQVLFTATNAGSYAVRVSYKGTITGGNQYYSLIVSGCAKDTRVPFIDITNAPPPVLDFDVALFTFGGTNAPLTDDTNLVAGTMWWTNNSNGAHGTMPAAQNWVVDKAAIRMGMNVMMVYGTNALGMLGKSVLTIMRDAHEPFVDITNATLLAVSYDTTACTLGGTNNAHVEGTIWWTNLAANVAGTVARDGDTWHVTVPLKRGTAATVNRISVFGTNLWDLHASDSIDITVGGNGTGAPFIDVTSTPVSVSYEVTSWNIGGTNNAHIVGTMRWTNLLTGARGTLSALKNWNVSNIMLAVDSNVIAVFGTNAYGVSGSDSVTIMREMPEPELVLVLMLLAGFNIRAVFC